MLALDGCTLKTETRNVVIFNVPSPNFISPGEGLPDQNDPSEKNATLWLNPGEVGRVTLRVYDSNRADNVTYTNPDGTTASIDPRFNPATVTTVGISGQGVDVLDPPGATEPPAVTTTGTNLFFLQIAFFCVLLGASAVWCVRNVQGAGGRLIEPRPFAAGARDVALEAQAAMEAEIPVRVVSMPSTNVFDRQDAAYRESVLPRGVPRVAIEAGVTDGWYKYVGVDGVVIGLDRFGESAPAGQLFKEFGFTAGNVVKAVEKLI